MARRFEATYDASPSNIRMIREDIAGLAHGCGFDDSEVAEVRLAVSEAATNAVLHGCAPQGGCKIHVEAEVVGDELRVEIADEGVGLRPRADSPGLGIGLSVMAVIADRLEITEGDPGTHVRMAFPCSKAA